MTGFLSVVKQGMWYQIFRLIKMFSINAVR